MRKILISGASRGIGKAIALKLLKEGHSLSLGVREREDLFNTRLDPRTKNSDSFLVHTYDATDHKSSKEWVDKTFEIFKSIDTINHCAGILKKTDLILNENEIKDISFYVQPIVKVYPDKDLPKNERKRAPRKSCSMGLYHPHPPPPPRKMFFLLRCCLVCLQCLSQGTRRLTLIDPPLKSLLGGGSPLIFLFVTLSFLWGGPWCVPERLLRTLEYQPVQHQRCPRPQEHQHPVQQMVASLT